MSSAHYAPPPNPRIPQPKVDGNDRRAIEARNEDKHNTTKEALSDIKRIHNIEKKKKEQRNMKPGPSGINNPRWVSKTFIL